MHSMYTRYVEQRAVYKFDKYQTDWLNDIDKT